MDPFITIGQPAAGATVPSSFQASGQVNPAGSAVTVTLNGTTVNATVNGNTWTATFQNIKNGTYTLTATITGTTTKASESITVQG